MALSKLQAARSRVTLGSSQTAKGFCPELRIINFISHPKEFAFSTYLVHPSWRSFRLTRSYFRPLFPLLFDSFLPKSRTADPPGPAPSSSSISTATMAGDSDLPKSADKGKGKAVDAGKKPDELKKDKDGKAIPNGQKDDNEGLCSSLHPSGMFGLTSTQLPRS